MIITKTPFRVSLFGGGSDFPEFYANQRYGGAVIGFSVPYYCWITLRHLPQYFTYRHRVVWSKIELVTGPSELENPIMRAVLELAVGDHDGLEVHHIADWPARAGGGSSSAFAVGLINALAALRGVAMSPRELAAAAIDIERIRLAEPGGHQDQIWCSMGGGPARIDFLADGFSYRPLVMPPARVRDLLDHLLLVFTGFSRQASQIEADKIAHLTEPDSAAALVAIRASVDEAQAILESTRDLRDLGPLLHTVWQAKRQLSPGVSTFEVDTLYDNALRAGALGGKLLGAGGGGFLLLFVEPTKKARVREALRGLIETPVAISQDGSRVVVYAPDGL